MLMVRVEPELDRMGAVAIRLLRRWAAVRQTDQPTLRDLVSIGASLGVSPETIVAFASLFQLTEACLGRRLIAECCCSPELSPGERAVLLMLAAAPAPAHPGASREIPHGLPGALAWAVASVRNLMGEAEAPRFRSSPNRCPFRSADLQPD